MTQPAETIGFVGAGLMGHGMAARLLGAGYPLTVIANRNRAPIDDLVAKGAQEAKTPRELAAASTIVFLCLNGSHQVEAIVRGPEGLAAGARAGSVIIDCSTSIPTSTIALAQELAAKDVSFCDAPLGGTPVQAATGELSAMVGAAPDLFERIRPVCAAWAKKVTHLGPVGDGHKMKLLNNFVSLGYAAIYAEALLVAEKVGISAQTFDSVISGSRMDNLFYQQFMRYALQGDRDAHKFTIANALKDSRYLETMAKDAGAPNPVGNAVKNSFARAAFAGGLEDFVPMLPDFVAGRLPPRG